MGVFVRRSHRDERPARGSSGGNCYRSATYSPLRPWQVRERHFRPSRFGRRGLDPDEVREFLDRVAGDLSFVYEVLARSRDETARIKEALRQWQSRQTRTVNERSHH